MLGRARARERERERDLEISRDIKRGLERDDDWEIGVMRCARDAAAAF